MFWFFLAVLQAVCNPCSKIGQIVSFFCPVFYSHYYLTQLFLTLLCWYQIRLGSGQTAAVIFSQRWQIRHPKHSAVYAVALQMLCLPERNDMRNKTITSFGAKCASFTSEIHSLMHIAVSSLTGTHCDLNMGFSNFRNSSGVWNIISRILMTQRTNALPH